VKTFNLYHTNDIHSHFAHWSRIVAYLKEARHHHRLRKESVLQFDIGDHVDRFHPLTEGTLGRGNVRLLNEVGYDGVTIGNNEGITFSKNDLEQLYADAAFPVLVANLFDHDGVRPESMDAYRIYPLDNGLNIGVIGVTIPFTAFYRPLGWTVKNPAKVLTEMIKKIRKKADIVVLLSHVGYFNDMELAREIDGIDIILGAHTHHLLKQGVNVKGTTIAQAGKFGQYVGQLKVTYDDHQQTIVDCQVHCVPIDRYKEDERTKRLLTELSEEGKAKLNTPVANLPVDFTAPWFEPSPLVERLAQGLKEWCEADISMVNAGVLLEGLPKGLVTKGDLHRICPHPINPCKVKIKGSELKETIRHAFSDDIRGLELKGLGFRGKVLGAFVFDGVNVETVRLADGGFHVRSITMRGQELEPEHEYELATLDTFSFGQLFPAIRDAGEKQFYLPETLRDLLAWKLQQLA
jgi:5'-nucleotidase